jgi:predicted metal-dependent enzyme (double-stranded beta helix superfamily)
MAALHGAAAARARDVGLATSLSERDVFGLSVDAVHSVTNPIPRFTGAIHVYGGDFFGTPRSEWDPETLQERPFDLEAARRTFQEASARASRRTLP